MKLVIVESPAKATTIGRYLGAGYDVIASVGHAVAHAGSPPHRSHLVTAPESAS